MALILAVMFLNNEGTGSLLSLLKWPVVAFVLMASLSPEYASARTQSPVNAPTVEQTVREKFLDVPILIKIARCESRFRQYNTDGSPLYNERGSSAVGVMQIMSSVHNKSARSLGYDITTTEGNLAYARHLYEKEGTQPWQASAGCWS